MDKILKYLNENLFVAVFGSVAAFSVSMHITSEEGRAALYETLSLGLAKGTLYFATLFLLLKFLAGVDKNVNDDLFTNPDNTTRFVQALTLGTALVFMG